LLLVFITPSVVLPAYFRVSLYFFSVNFEKFQAYFVPSLLGCGTFSSYVSQKMAAPYGVIHQSFLGAITV